MFHYFKQEDILGIELNSSPRKFLVGYDLKDLVYILKNTRIIEFRTSFHDFLWDNQKEIKELIKLSSKDGGPLYNIDVMSSIEKATYKSVWYLSSLDEDILLNIFEAIFIPLKNFLRIVRISKESLESESTILTKAQFDKAFIEELEENCFLCFLKK